MRRRAFRWAIAAVVFVIFGALMWLWRQGAEWLIHAFGPWVSIPTVILIVAFGWYAERKGWLT